MFLLPDAQGTASGPVHNVANPLPVISACPKQFCRLPVLTCADEAGGVLQSQQRACLQYVVVALNKCGITCIEVVIPCQQDGLQYPLGWPCGIVAEVVCCVSGHGVFTVRAVMSQLVDNGIGFVGNALAVAIDIYAGEGRRLYTISAEIPYLVQYGIRAMEVGCFIVPGVVYHLTFCLFQTCPSALHLDIAKGIDLTNIIGHEYRANIRTLRFYLGISPVGTENELVGIEPFVYRQLVLGITDASAWLLIDAPVLFCFAQTDGQRIGRITLYGQFQLSKGCLAEVHHPQPLTPFADRGRFLPCLP